MSELEKLGPDATATQMEAATYLDVYDLGRKHGLGWKPIDTAPLDCMLLLARAGHPDGETYVSMGFWAPRLDPDEGYWSVLVPFAPDLHPTHWMPMPPPPEGD